MQNDNYITNISVERFEAAFRSADDVGAVIRCEYEIERAAWRALSTIIPKYDSFKHRYLSEHLKTFRAFGCAGPIFQVADYVRKMRNEFAHEGKEAITDKHIVELSSQAGSGFGGKPLADWTVGAGFWGVASETNWSMFGNRQKFVLASSLDAAAFDMLPQRIPRIIHLDHLRPL